MKINESLYPQHGYKTAGSENNAKKEDKDDTDTPNMKLDYTVAETTSTLQLPGGTSAIKERLDTSKMVQTPILWNPAKVARGSLLWCQPDMIIEKAYTTDRAKETKEKEEAKAEAAKKAQEAKDAIGEASSSGGLATPQPPTKKLKGSNESR